jgi:D-alanyl-D-alanine carboxypeptidase
MKSIKHPLFIICLLLLISVAACKKTPAGCEYDDNGTGSWDGWPAYIKFCTSTDFETPITDVTSGKTFNHDKFIAALNDSLLNVGGVQYAVLQGGFVYLNSATGVARAEGACPEGALTPCNKMNIASCTKLMTAACVMKMLYDQGLDEDDTIGPFLPVHWSCPATMRALRFQDLLRHRSGLHQFTSNTNFDVTLGYNGLQTLAQTGPNTDSIGLSRYRNANYALMRIIIPALWKNLPSCPGALQAADTITDAISQQYYDEAIRQFVLNPVGAEGELDAAAMGDFETLYYTTSGANSSGAGNWKNKAGGGGWNMTALDMAKVINGIYNNVIVSTTVRDAMLNNGIGFWNNLTVTDGSFRGHGGDITTGSSEMHSLMVHHTTQNISIAVNINTGTINGLGLYNIVQNAYNQAWE